jgi:hypothetical protein
MEIFILFYIMIIAYVFTNIHAIIISKNQLLNSYSFFTLDFTIKVILSPVIVYIFYGEVVNYESVVFVLFLSLVFLFSVYIGFILKKVPIFLVKNSSIFTKNTYHIRLFYNNLGFFFKLFFIIGIIFYFLLMVRSGVNTMWLTDTRNAYEFHRSGVGAYYVFSQFFLFLSFILLLFNLSYKRKILKIIISTIFFMYIFTFFGSKKSLLTLILISMTYYSYNVYKIKIFRALIMFAMISLLFLYFQNYYSNFNLTKSFNYFNYFNSMVLFFENVQNFEYYYGSNTLGNLWGLVPRSIYPDKPYVYASAVITETISPGAPAEGRYMGVLHWVTYYLDFGVLGVLFWGLITGMILRYLQELIVLKNNIFTFIIFFNFAITYLLLHVPFIVIIAIMLLFITILRIRVNRI